MKKLLKRKRNFQLLKFDLKMKLSALFLFTALFAMHANNSYSQRNKVTLNVNQKSVHQVLEQIERKTDYQFSYKLEDVDLNRKVTLKVSDELVTRVLDVIFDHSDTEYTIIDKQVFLLKRKRPAPADPPTSGLRAQAPVQLRVTGTVVDDKNIPLPAVNILEKGTNNGTSTDFDGNYSITVGEGAVLVFSTIGFETREVSVGSETTVNVSLKPATEQLGEVVVTALGIKKEKRALTYAVTEVDGEQFTQAKETNLANALSGRIAGVNVSSLATGAGGSSRVVIRGNTSLSGNNQPLYVINGMPMDNTTMGGSATTSGGGFNIDHGDGTGGINPDDIESISVLKGATAAALYGSRASNGAIIITTKKGALQQGLGIEINSSFTLDSPMDFTDWQYEYGQGNGGKKPANQSEAVTWGRRNWGARIDGSPYIAFDGQEHPYTGKKNNIKNFYDTGSTFTNTVAISGGGETTSYRFSASDTDNKGLVPNNTFNRRIFSLNFNSRIGEKLTLEGMVQFNKSKAYNKSSAGDATGNPNWVNMLANTVDVRWLDPGYDENGTEVEWNETPYASNPYFVANKFKNNEVRERFIGQFSLNYQLTDNLSVKGSVSKDYTDFNFTAILPTGTLYTINAAGEYHGFDLMVSETNSMLNINYNKDLSEDINLGAMIGGNIRKYKNEQTSYDGTQFIIPDFYSFTNLATSTTVPTNKHLTTNSLFASLDLSYKNFLYLNATARQDWFSTLTASDGSNSDNSIFYPSVGAGFIFSQVLKLPEWISYGKLRGSWAQVGGGLPDPYTLSESYTMTPSSGEPLQQVTQVSGQRLLANSNLRPYTSTTYEFGLEAKMFNNRFGFDIAYYDKTTTDDIVNAQLPVTTGYEYTYFNVGKVANQGVELTLDGTPVRNDNFTWNVNYNLAYNKSEVQQLAEGLNTISVASSVNNWAEIHHEVGEPFGIIKGYSMQRDEAGNIVFDSSSGFPVKSELKKIGNSVAPLSMGFNNRFTYKNFTLDVLVDGKFGNDVFSVLNIYATRFGLSKRTLEGREDGLTLTGVDQSGNPYTNHIPSTDIRSYYQNLRNYSDQFVYDGSFVKLRQVVFSYNIPVEKLKLFKLQSASISFIARNLALLYSKTDNFDPESSYTNSNAQGFESFALPRTRSYGLNLKLKF
ncbi:SusC/RagA family TonB-linked outer membrane protein [Sinomicrobium weinanense]|uniref:SusC/RagA family TonB-linked outer membrane protein n=1 Tax=Sinomicrobium weinanense TaxID=2842200 RepID=A0A926JT33_9FLAO|nr:SusC/RagA family TonB-linked outer membrane protein [Sinomicrobium weinanense]MBC9796814.1 SusC/RagA family TonB-linked outer membrane protein [Sinomicrobium weinanense]MBU3123682.1 SusC/RagA family TonB-linked outer membrane protein [Sinomicrobium weinanense]